MNTATQKETAALVLGAGLGERLGAGPKAFLKLSDGRTLLDHVVSVLRPEVARVIVGVPADSVAAVRKELKGQAEVLAGGPSRQETLRLLFMHSTEPLLLIHEVARPFASAELMRRIIAAGQANGAAAAFTPLHIPVARIRGDRVAESVGRADLRLPQSPQAYTREVLTAAYQFAHEHGVETQTTWQLVLLAGASVAVVEGEEHNIKITTALDWEIAQRAIWPMRSRRKGEGHEH